MPHHSEEIDSPQRMGRPDQEAPVPGSPDRRTSPRRSSTSNSLSPSLSFSSSSRLSGHQPLTFHARAYGRV